MPRTESSVPTHSAGAEWLGQQLARPGVDARTLLLDLYERGWRDWIVLGNLAWARAVGGDHESAIACSREMEALRPHLERLAIRAAALAHP